MNKIYVNDEIAKMLECLIGKNGINRNKCKTCTSADACCFLMEAVYVVHHVHYKESSKAKSVL